MTQTSLLTNICDEEILALLHPSVFDLVGPNRTITKEVGDIEKIIYRHERGNIEIARDFNTVKIHSVMSDGKESVLFKIRDRRFDGTPRYRSPLTEWPYDAEYDKAGCKAVELSRYSRDPSRYFLDNKLTAFLKEPFDYIFGDPGQFIRLWKRAFRTEHYPGQSALPLKGAANFFSDRARALVNSLGYEVTVSPSHYYVASFGLNRGYVFQSSAQKAEYDELDRLMAEFDLDSSIEKQQKSWIILLQKFPSLRNSELAHFWLRGLEYPLYYDGEKAENVWLYPHDSRYEFPDFEPKHCIERLKSYGCDRT